MSVVGLIVNIGLNLLSDKLFGSKQREAQKKEAMRNADFFINNEIIKNSKYIEKEAFKRFNNERFEYVYLYFRIYFFRNIFVLLGLFLFLRLLINKK